MTPRTDAQATSRPSDLPSSPPDAQAVLETPAYRRLQIFNLPNRITLGRLLISLGLFTILALIQAGAVAAHGFWGWAAFVLFVTAAGTDVVDGHLARRLGLVTAFGRIMDPFVDKVVVCGSFVFLAALQPPLIAPWMVVVILGREFFVNAIRGFMESRGVSFGAELPGKLKMVLQCLAIGGMLFWLAIGDPLLSEPGWLSVTVTVLVWATLVSTVSSGWFYARKAFELLSHMKG